MITITDNAISKLHEIITEEPDSGLKLRVFVQGGGCSGFQYGFTLDHEVAEDDLKFTYDDVEVVVDPISYQYLEDVTINFLSGLEGEQFTISNPGAATTCGCGSSFSPF